MPTDESSCSLEKGVHADRRRTLRQIYVKSLVSIWGYKHRLVKKCRVPFVRSPRRTSSLRKVPDTFFPLIAKLSVLVHFAAGCRLPPPPEASDLSSGWMRQESVSSRSASQLAENRSNQLQITDLATACDVAPAWFDQIPDGERSEMDRVVSQVLSVNHDFEAAEATWRATMELYPQATSWEDPNLRFQNGPTIFGDSQGAHLWRLQVSQVIPWFGKTGLRGELADRSADVSHFQWRQMRQELVSLARSAYLDYARNERLYELQQADYRLAKSMLDPPAPYTQVAHEMDSEESRAALEFDLLELEEQQQQVETARHVARERLNTLRHRPLDAEATVETPPTPDVPDVEPLQQRALRRSPQLAIARYREKRAETQLRLSEKEFYPDIRLVGRFDTNASRIWAPNAVSLRPQLGIYFYPPLQQGRRWAKHREMKQRVRQRKAETQAVINKLESEIDRQVAAMDRSTKHLALLDRLIVAAERKVENQRSLVSTGGQGLKAHVNARREVLKYRMKRIKAEFTRLQQFNELAKLTGQDAWVGDDPADAAGEWKTTLPFLPVSATPNLLDTGFPESFFSPDSSLRPSDSLPKQPVVVPTRSTPQPSP